MTPERWQRVKETAAAALELEPGRRPQFLDQECGSDTALRRAVEALLEADEQAGQTIDAAIAAAASGVAKESGGAGSDPEPGQAISHYRVLEKLGAGGMGVVYKAQDTKLERPVALKFLATHAVEDPEYKARFIREAKAAARLDHQNICPVYEIDEAAGQTFLAMAYLEGQTVKDKIDERPLELAEALDIAIQAAQGLQAAHEKGIVHRDVKSANLMVTPQGQVRIMDFGLAQLAERSKLTKTATILGTPAYMSPEQAKRQPTDRRTDIWSLGVVIYEMITGRLPFDGERQEAVLYAIGKEDPEPITALRAGVPMELEWIVGKALAKDAGERYQHVEEMIVDLKTVSKKLAGAEGAAAAQGTTPKPAWDAQRSPTTQRPGVHRAQPSLSTRIWLPWALFAITALGLGVTYVRLSEPAPESPVRRFSFTPDSLVHVPFIRAAVSPDSRWIVYVSGEYPPTLWLRDIASGQIRKLEGTEHASAPFWSPDSRFIGFGANFRLKKITIEGGPAIDLCGLGLLFAGGAWSPDGETIVFSSGEFPPRLFEVAAGGGERRLLFEPVQGDKGAANAQPHFLPPQAGTRALLFVVGGYEQQDIYLRNLDNGETVKLAEGARPLYSPTGHILYQTSIFEGGLWALPFSLKTLQPMGEAFPIAEGVGDASLASDGTLVAVDVTDTKQRLVWRDRHGNKLGEIGRPQAFIQFPQLSPDGRRVVVMGRGAHADADAIWLHQVERAVSRRLTSGGMPADRPSWSPDGEAVTFLSNRRRDLMVRRADGVGEPKTLIASDAPLEPFDWAPNGRALLYGFFPGTGTGSDIWLLTLDEDGEAQEQKPFLATQFHERMPQFSPDGRWVAYCSDVARAGPLSPLDRGFEVYVRAFPEGDQPWQISESGGCEPRWSQDGTEIFYVERETKTLVAVEVTVQPDFRDGQAERLFADPNLLGTTWSWAYDVSADGRFVLVEDATPELKPALRITQNWYAEFRGEEPD